MATLNGSFEKGSCNRIDADVTMLTISDHLKNNNTKCNSAYFQCPKAFTQWNPTVASFFGVGDLELLDIKMSMERLFSSNGKTATEKENVDKATTFRNDQNEIIANTYNCQKVSQLSPIWKFETDHNFAHSQVEHYTPKYSPDHEDSISRFYEVFPYRHSPSPSHPNIDNVKCPPPFMEQNYFELQKQTNSDFRINSPLNFNVPDSQVRKSCGKIKTSASDNDDNESTCDEAEQIDVKSKEKKKSHRQRDLNSAKLWEWVLHLLLNPDKYGDIVNWDNREKGIFKISNKLKLTKVYNHYKSTVSTKSRSKDEKAGIQYESITRALRHCYKTKVIERVAKKHKYEFGIYAVNWRQGISRERAISSIDQWEKLYVEGITLTNN